MTKCTKCGVYHNNLKCECTTSKIRLTESKLPTEDPDVDFISIYLSRVNSRIKYLRGDQT